jgi:hypothetical protein
VSKRLDLVSIVVIVMTFALFVLALFTKGFTHDLLLEAGVLLVSIKLIIMSGKLAESAKLFEGKLEAIETSLQRMQDHERDKAERSSR